ncbi:MAG TPA: hypothetical protein VFT39_00615 [Vicinamibacterales bacterium]|nr:hypothetical protein [Vicinamibacterales bacterium]
MTDRHLYELQSHCVNCSCTWCADVTVDHGEKEDPSVSGNHGTVATAIDRVPVRPTVLADFRQHTAEWPGHAMRLVGIPSRRPPIPAEIFTSAVEFSASKNVPAGLDRRRP